MSDRFEQIWNTLVLLTQVEYFGDVNEGLDTIKKMASEAVDNQQLTMVEYLALANSINAWREVYKRRRHTYGEQAAAAAE